MSDLVYHLLNSGQTAPPRSCRLRRWLPVGGALQFRDGLLLQLLRERDDETRSLRFHAQLGGRSGCFDALAPGAFGVSSGAKVVVRAVAMRAHDVPIAALVELQVPPTISAADVMRVHA